MKEIMYGVMKMILMVNKSTNRYKLHMISNFGEWWYPQHKSVYQKMLIEALN